MQSGPLLYRSALLAIFHISGLTAMRGESARQKGMQVFTLLELWHRDGWRTRRVPREEPPPPGAVEVQGRMDDTGSKGLCPERVRTAHGGCFALSSPGACG